MRSALRASIPMFISASLTARLMCSSWVVSPLITQPSAIAAITPGLVSRCSTIAGSSQAPGTRTTIDRIGSIAGGGKSFERALHQRITNRFVVTTGDDHNFARGQIHQSIPLISVVILHTHQKFGIVLCFTQLRDQDFASRRRATVRPARAAAPKFGDVRLRPSAFLRGVFRSR